MVHMKRLSSRHGPSQTQGVTLKHFGPNKEASPGELNPGDFILTHGNSFFSKLIRFGQRLRFVGRNRKYAEWSHAAIIVSREGELIEAEGAGVILSNISKYKATEYRLVQLGSLANEVDREQAVRYARWCLGESYGIISILSIVFGLVFGGKFSFGFDGQQICSGLVAGALERTNVIFDRSPSHILPADLAKYFSVEPLNEKDGITT
jgi:uncharacterized protein YycO